MSSRDTHAEDRLKASVGDKLGASLLNRHVLVTSRLRGERVVSGLAYVQARNQAEFERSQKNELALALATKIIDTPYLYSMRRGQDELEGIKYRIDTVVFCPSTLEQVLAAVWQEGYNARNAEVS